MESGVESGEWRVERGLVAAGSMVVRVDQSQESRLQSACKYYLCSTCHHPASFLQSVTLVSCEKDKVLCGRVLYGGLEQFIMTLLTFDIVI